MIVRQGEQRVPLRPVTADLERASAILWVTVHDAAENGLLSQAGVPPERISTVPQVDRGLRSVAEGHADALAISAVTAWHLVATHPEWPLEVRTLSDAPAGFPAFVFRQDDLPLRDAMDQALRAYLGSEEHQALVKAFGFTSEEMPPALP